ncbi:hypothetical protein NE237_007371 [Protea cynaroides]|uniref:Uncharacterized protein n=1 Tax=Protea cynaroides TaxID=273540 RepID=A0A9Q0KP39_9MAGN|nr:hypothetical protein NE237_007371 [Protea cynaroides]
MVLLCWVCVTDRCGDGRARLGVSCGQCGDGRARLLGGRDGQEAKDDEQQEGEYGCCRVCVADRCGDGCARLLGGRDGQEAKDDEQQEGEHGWYRSKMGGGVSWNGTRWRLLVSAQWWCSVQIMRGGVLQVSGGGSMAGWHGLFG